MPYLYEVPYSRVAPYRSAAAKEHVSVTDTKKTWWFEWPNVGFCGLIEVRKGVRARIKGVYVYPEERGSGKGTVMTQELMEIAELMGYTELEAFALNPKFYVGLGWKQTATQLGSGAWKVERVQ